MPTRDRHKGSFIKSGIDCKISLRKISAAWVLFEKCAVKVHHGYSVDMFRVYIRHGSQRAELLPYPRVVRLSSVSSGVKGS